MGKSAVTVNSEAAAADATARGVQLLKESKETKLELVDVIIIRTGHVNVATVLPAACALVVAQPCAGLEEVPALQALVLAVLARHTLGSSRAKQAACVCAWW